MNEDELRQLVIHKVVTIAPDIQPDDIDPEKNFRDQFDFDSIDFLNLMMALSRELGIDIPELAYPALSSVEGAVGWLKEKV